MRPPQQNSEKALFCIVSFAKEPYWCMSLLQKSHGEMFLLKSSKKSLAEIHVRALFL